MSDRKKKKQWGKKATGTKGEPTMGQVIREKRKEELAPVKATPWTMEDKLKCLEYYAELKDPAQVALKLKRSEIGVRKFLQRYQSTTTGARLTLEAGAEKLARRIIKDANVEESMEVLDRLDVLPSVDRGKSQPATSFQVIVGMPIVGQAQPNSVPVPTQKQIQAAKEAVVDAEVVDGASQG